MINPKEKTILETLGDAWNQFYAMVPAAGLDKDDIDDFRRSIHECQRIVACLSVARDNQQLWKQ